jgi:hypothetical protein
VAKTAQSERVVPQDAYMLLRRWLSPQSTGYWVMPGWTERAQQDLEWFKLSGRCPNLLAYERVRSETTGEVAYERERGERTVIGRKSGLTVRPFAHSNGLTRTIASIQELASSTPSWAGHDVAPPNRVAIALAKSIAVILFNDGLTPDRVVASGEGGIALCFIQDTIYVDIECLNEGEILVGMRNQESGETDVWSFDMSQASIDRITDVLTQDVHHRPV